MTPTWFWKFRATLMLLARVATMFSAVVVRADTLLVHLPEGEARRLRKDCETIIQRLASQDDAEWKPTSISDVLRKHFPSFEGMDIAIHHGDDESLKKHDGPKLVFRLARRAKVLGYSWIPSDVIQVRRVPLINSGHPAGPGKVIGYRQKKPTKVEVKGSDVWEYALMLGEKNHLVLRGRSLTPRTRGENEFSEAAPASRAVLNTGLAISKSAMWQFVASGKLVIQGDELVLALTFANPTNTTIKGNGWLFLANSPSIQKVITIRPMTEEFRWQTTILPNLTRTQKAHLRRGLKKRLHLIDGTNFETAKNGHFQLTPGIVYFSFSEPRFELGAPAAR